MQLDRTLFPTRYTPADLHDRYPDFQYGFHATDASNLPSILATGLQRKDGNERTWQHWEDRLTRLIENGHFCVQRHGETDDEWEQKAAPNYYADDTYYEDDARIDAYRDAFASAEFFFWNNWSDAVGEALRGHYERDYRRTKGDSVDVTRPVILIHDLPSQIDYDPENNYTPDQDCDPTAPIKQAFYSFNTVEPEAIRCVCLPDGEIVATGHLFWDDDEWQCFCKE